MLYNQHTGVNAMGSFNNYVCFFYIKFVTRVEGVENRVYYITDLIHVWNVETRAYPSGKPRSHPCGLPKETTPT